MYLTISEELTRQYREELMHEMAMARPAKEVRAKGNATFRLLRNLRWELVRYAGLVGKRIRR